MSMFKNFIITIDGPAGSGKSTSAKLIAKRLGFNYLDTGAMYRAITYLALRNKITENEEKVVKLAEKVKLNLNFTNGKTIVIVDNENITDEIRNFEVNAKVSDISKIAGVRKALVKLQKEIGSENNIVAEGRDIGTVVFPAADVKIYLVASLNERANRRLKEFEQKSESISFEDIKNNIISRDYIDSHRDVSPLIKAKDAYEIDTSELTIEEQVNKILEIVETVAKDKNFVLNQSEST
jgi:cytidylate kinase